MSDIFISYSRKDLAIVSRLASALEELGYSVWWDVRGLHGGQAFASVIKGEIDKARCAIVVWSKASVVSEWVHAEASHANNRRPSILLTTIYQDADIPLPFNTRHNEDLRGWKGDPFDPQFQKLLLAVTRYCPHPSNPPGRKETRPGGEVKGSGGVLGPMAAGLAGGVIAVAATAGVFLYLQQPNKPEPAPARVAAIPAPVSPPAQPAPVERYQLTANVKPENAQISVDSEAYEPGMMLPPGKYTLEVEADGYQPLEKAFTIASGDVTLNVELKPDHSEYEPEMVSIQGGTFTMGCKEDRDDVEGGCYDDEKPAHKVTVNAFQMGKHEVAFDQWDECEKANACPHAEDQGWGRGDRPVINVSWDDITQKYIPWLNQATGKNYRLPTEAEWEYAARGGSDTAYPWGNKASHEFANYGKDECCDGLASGKDKWVYTSPVGSFAANGYGLYDMNGNVWEWVQDRWHGDYKGAPVDGSSWESGDSALRVVRGGSWSSTPRHVRSASRNNYTPAHRDLDYGFRVASGQ